MMRARTCVLPYKCLMGYIKVTVTAAAKKESITKLGDDSYAISVKEKAERNQANKRVRELIADIFQVPLGAVTIVTGHKRPNKIVFIRPPTQPGDQRKEI